MKFTRRLPFLFLMFSTLTARAACLEHGVPAADLPVTEQSTFWADVLFEADFTDCSAEELSTIQTLLLADLKAVKSDYISGRKGRVPELTTFAANFKSSLVLVRLAKFRRSLE